MQIAHLKGCMCYAIISFEGFDLVVYKVLLGKRGEEESILVSGFRPGSGAGRGKPHPPGAYKRRLTGCKK